MAEHLVDYGGHTITAREDETLLAAALRAGLDVPRSRRTGTCRPCLARLGRGKVRFLVRWHSRCMRLAFVCLWFFCASAIAAPQFQDTIAQRTLACTSCHGKEGRAGPDGYYPRIAGKPAGYLYNQLLNFREGRRHYGLMARLLDPLSEPYLFEIAQYFASLDLPYPPPRPANVPASS